MVFFIKNSLDFSLEFAKTFLGQVNELCNSILRTCGFDILKEWFASLKKIVSGELYVESVCNFDGNVTQLSKRYNKDATNTPVK